MASVDSSNQNDKWFQDENVCGAVDGKNMLEVKGKRKNYLCPTYCTTEVVFEDSKFNISEIESTKGIKVGCEVCRFDCLLVYLI